MQRMTVRELADQLNYLVRLGLGDREVFISDDDEGNGYHALYNGVNADPASITDTLVYAYTSEADVDPYEIVLLG
ncbi:MAG: hypothetical protein E7Z63_01120 [Thermoplasmata archaeon]|nr:hypothetical protein [Thermoplasmata archaeon]